MTDNAENRPIRWRRVLLYGLALFLLTFAGGCVGGSAAGIYRSAQEDLPTWVNVLRVTLVPAATVLVFAWVGRAEVDNPTGHAAAVWVIGVVTTFVLNVGIMRIPLTWVALSILPLTLCALIGTSLGVFTRRT